MAYMREYPPPGGGKMSKFRLFGRDKLQDHTCLMKEKERRKRKSEEEEKRRRRKSNGGVLSFYNGYFGEKKTVGRKRSIWR